MSNVVSNIVPLRRILPVEFFEYKDKSGEIILVSLYEDGFVEANTRSGKTVFAAYLSRFATNNGKIVINLCKNLNSQVADWELKHRWLNEEGEALFIDNQGLSHEFITDSFNKSLTFQRDLENPGRGRIYHGLKNDRTILSLYDALHNCNVKNNSIVIIGDEAHHSFHKTNRKRDVYGNQNLAKLIEDFRDKLTVFGLSATGNVVRDNKIWKHHYFLNSKKDYDLLEDTTQVYIDWSEYQLWRYRQGVEKITVPSTVSNLIKAECEKPGVGAMMGQPNKKWHSQMKDHILDIAPDSLVLVVNSGKYRLCSKTGEVLVTKDENNKNINNMMGAITKVFSDHPRKKIFVVGHNMLIEGESFRDAAGSICLTSLFYCPVPNPVDEVARQAVGRMELEIAEENGWKVVVCSTEEHFTAVVEYGRDSLKKAKEKARGEEYSDPHYMHPRLNSSMKNKAPSDINPMPEFNLVAELEKLNPPRYTVPSDIDVDEIFGRKKGTNKQEGEKRRNGSKIMNWLRNEQKEKYKDKKMALAYVEYYRLSYLLAEKVKDRTFVVNAGENRVFVLTPEWRKDNFTRNST